jgi:hypothetical protein
MTVNNGRMAANSHNPITYFARTNYRDKRIPFGIRRSDRLAHMYTIGKTGTGKSTMLETMIIRDLEHGEGFALFDPHGELAERVLAGVPDSRRLDIVYFNVPDDRRPLGFNPLESVPPHRRAVAALGLLEALKKIWADSWGPRMEHILRNALLALLDQPEATLADVPRLLDDRAYRRAAMTWVESPQVRHFWLQEYEAYPARFRIEAIAPVQNKVGAFLSNPLLSRILTQPRTAFNMRRLMDEGKILIVNLAKGRIGEDTAALMGALLVTQVGLAALSRTDVPSEGRRPFFVYLDEFQSFTTLSLANMLSELRKYGVGMVLAHQYLSQLDPEVRDAIVGNVGTIVSFRVGLADAEILAREFEPEFSATDLALLPNYHIYLKLMINGKVSRPFSAVTEQT